MKKIFTFLSAGLFLMLLTSCPKNDSTTPETGEFSIDVYTNPTDPTLLQLTYEDGTMVTYTGTKDVNGMPLVIRNVNVTFPDTEGNFLLTLDDNMMPVSQLTPNGTVFEYIWNNDSTMRLKAISPSGQVQVIIPIDLKGGKSSGKGEVQPPQNIRDLVRVKSVLNDLPKSQPNPLKPAEDNAMIFHVVKCGMDVTNATVVMNVTPKLGTSSFPCKNIGNGFYSTNVPKSGEPPANYEQQCDKVGDVVKNVCSKYDLVSMFGTGIATQVCQFLADEIAASFPGGPDGDKIKAMCGKSIGALDALCKFAGKQDIAELCKLANLLYTDPKGGYSFTVTVNVPGSAAFTPGSQTFDPANPQTYLVDVGGSFDLTNLHTVPVDPAPSEGYTAFADVICPNSAGTSVTISIVGTDGYTNSSTQTFTANGTISLYIPGGAQSVKDVITVTGEGISKSISIVF